MKTELPLWVTLALGVLAIVGPIGGAWVGGLVSARRDDTRWQQQQERDEAAWSRQVADAERTYWRTRRTEAYASLIVSWNELIAEANKVTEYLVQGKLIPNELKQTFGETVSAIKTQSANVEIEASELVRLAAVAAVGRALEVQVKALNTEISLHRNSPDAAELAAGAERAVEGLTDGRDHFIDAVRSDLSVPTK